MTARWRTGTKVKRTVYEGDQIMFLCTTAEDAERIVALLNRGEVSRVLAEALERHCKTHDIFSNGNQRFADCQCDSCDKARAALAQYAAQSAPVESGTGGGGK